MNEQVAAKAARLPTGPGIYIFLGEGGQVLYVGKAANLRARVRSYMRPGGDGRFLIRFLEDSAVDLDCVVTRTEQEALLLENTVIKKRKPRFNIRLKDDKAFLLLRLDRSEPWPWFRLVRRRWDQHAEYFGPYSSAKAVKRTLRLLHKVVALRDCRDGVFRNRTRPCIKYDMGHCPAPCVGKIERAEYDKLLDRAVGILKGDVQELLVDLREQMLRAAENLEFERAQSRKDQIQALEQVAEQQTVDTGVGDQDALGLHRAGPEVTAVFLQFRSGKLESNRKFAFTSELPDELLLSDLLTRFYEGSRYVPPEILLPVEPAEAGILSQWLESKRGRKVQLRVPQRGPKRHHLDLAEENARMSDRLAADAEHRRGQGLQRLAMRVGGPDALLETIHCLDVSTMQGRDTVASRVASAGGLPDKDSYRRFKISARNAGDDFSAMGEAVGRSLQHCLDKEDGNLPDLLLVDGGRGQLAAAEAAVRELGLQDDLLLAGLAKSRLKGRGEAQRRTSERLFLPEGHAATPEEEADGIPLGEAAPETLIVAAVRDEAHRFAITYHRQQRSRLTSELDRIPGVGPGRRKALLKHLGSLKAVKAADREALRAVPGIPVSVADAVYEGLRASPGGSPEAS